MSLAKSVISLGLLAALAAEAQQSFSPSGQILGEVRNAAGVAQMGASVVLYDRYGQTVRRALSDEQGRFVLDALAPGIYTLRVSLASFMPVLRRNIAVLADSESLLRIDLAAVFSTLEFATPQAARAALMSDEWKWVLRSSHATRPVLRLREAKVFSTKTSRETAMFADTTGLVRLSAGDSTLTTGDVQQSLGTAFALETSFHGRDKVRVSGNLAYAAAEGMPSAGFRATYARRQGGFARPEVSLTVRQAYFPASVGSLTAGNTPILRMASVSSIDEIHFGGVLHLEYGASLDAVSLFGKMNFLSPFARATYSLGGRGALKAAFSNGAQPVDLLSREVGVEPDLNQDLNALSQLPRLSRRDNRAVVERTRKYEAGYELVRGAMRYGASVFREEVTNAAFLMSGADFLGPADLLPDLNTRGTLFNLGDYRRTGYGFSAARTLGETFEFGVAAGRAGALVADAPDLLLDDSDSVRRHVRKATRGWITVRASGQLPVTGTLLMAAYGWTDFRSLMPAHISLTGQMGQQTGWNAAARQPLPGIGGMRMELTAEMRNALAQGYLAVSSPDGRRAIFTNTPRALRGGVSFIF